MPIDSKPNPASSLHLRVTAGHEIGQVSCLAEHVVGNICLGKSQGHYASMSPADHLRSVLPNHHRPISGRSGRFIEQLDVSTIDRLDVSGPSGHYRGTPSGQYSTSGHYERARLNDRAKADSKSLVKPTLGSHYRIGARPWLWRARKQLHPCLWLEGRQPSDLRSRHKMTMPRVPQPPAEAATLASHIMELPFVDGANAARPANSKQRLALQVPASGGLRAQGSPSGCPLVSERGRSSQGKALRAMRALVCANAPGAMTGESSSQVLSTFPEQTVPAPDPIRDVLEAVWRRLPAVVVEAPPGSGKTRLVTHIAALVSCQMDERIWVACQTNAQMLDLAARLSTAFPVADVYACVRKGLHIPTELTGLANLTIVDSVWDLPGQRNAGENPRRPYVAVATSEKWASSTAICDPDVLVIDEAYQLDDATLAALSPSPGTRLVLVGDPGQIDPVISVDTARFDEQVGPHVPAPLSLRRRRPESVHTVKLSSTWRLPADSVRHVQPAFYPELPFTAVGPPRQLHPLAAGTPVIETLTPETSLLLATLPGDGSEHDPAVALTITGLIDRFLVDVEISVDGEAPRALRPSELGVVCAHADQVVAVQSLLGARARSVEVETAERWQGRETEVVFVWHPLSGRLDPGPFHLDAGRLCVMTSRHRSACILVGREGLVSHLAHAGRAHGRGLGADKAHDGWRAHDRLIRSLVAAGRVVHVDEPTRN